MLGYVEPVQPGVQSIKLTEIATREKIMRVEMTQRATIAVHGFSQVVDWYFRMDDYQKTSKFTEHFGTSAIDYIGILVLGRDGFLQQAGLVQRFAWRRKYTVINREHLQCFTFDELARELNGHYDSLIDKTS